MNPVLNTCCPEFFDQAFQFFGGHLLAAVLIEQFFSQLAQRFDTATGADTDVDLLVSDLLLEPPLRRIDIFRDQLIESFLAGLLIKDFEQAHTAHGVAFRAADSAVVRQCDFNTTSTDVHQQGHLVFQVDRFLRCQMNKPRFLFAADDRNLDPAGFCHRLQNGIPICRFAQCGGTNCLYLRNSVFFQLLFKFGKSLNCSVDGMGGYSTLRKNVLPETHGRPDVVNGLVSSVAIQVCYMQTNSVGSDIYGSESRHEGR